jgi:type I restriction enzyme S subunit
MIKLKDLCINITDGEHGSVKDDVNGIYFLLSNKNIINGNLVINQLEDRRISKESFDRINKRTKLEIGDILISTVGTIGKITVIESEVNFVVQRSVGIIKVNKEKLNPYFLKYQLMLPEFQRRLANLSKGAVQKCLFIGDLEELLISVPSISEQNQIANFLKLCDKKISINNSVNHILESIVKTIYDYWFLQFEFPNEEGRPYKSSGGKMVWNEELKKEIPEEWRVRSIKDVVTHITTGLNPRDHFILNDCGDINYITVKNLTIKGVLDLSGTDKITKEVKSIINSRSKTSKGDILFSSILPLGRCYLINDEFKTYEINESVFSIRVNNQCSPEYLYTYLKSEEFTKRAEHSSVGSIFGGIRISVLENMPVLVPISNILEKFTNQAIIYRNHLGKIEKENKELNSLRNFLLPMLMNEQVTFKDSKM